MNFNQFLNRAAFGPDVEVRVIRDLPAAKVIEVLDLLELLVDDDERVEVEEATARVQRAIALLRGEEP